MKPVVWVAAVVVLAGASGGLGSTGYSFDTTPRSIFQRPPDLARTVAGKRVVVKPVTVQPVLDGTDAASRARSWFDASTGEICRGTEIDKTCR